MINKDKSQNVFSKKKPKFFCNDYIFLNKLQNQLFARILETIFLENEKRTCDKYFQKNSRYFSFINTFNNN